MRFWVDNKIANEVEISAPELASMFIDGGWPGELEHRTIEQTVAIFLMELHLTWDSTDVVESNAARLQFDDLVDLIEARLDSIGSQP